MKVVRRRFLRLAGAAVAVPFVPRIARAQSYPTRPVTIIVPFAAGGPTDAIARVMGERLRVSLGQTVIIENVSGASGSIGVARAVRAAPDGYTISIGHFGSHVLNGAIYPLQYDLLKDLEPISLIASNPQIIIANKALPPNNLSELIAWLKAGPDKASAGTAGAGGPANVAGLFFQSMTSTRFRFVPYRGTAPAMQDLLAGQIDLMFDQAAEAVPQIRAGSVKAFAVTSNTRLEVAPEIPTVDEAGLPGFYASVWHGLWVPKSTPKDIVAKLNDAVVDTLADANVRARLASLGQEIPPRDQQASKALGAFQKAEIDRWWPIIKAAGIKGE
jgi:tripartite-type tricarboxylate transporter receptor subunit TctC